MLVCRVCLKSKSCIPLNRTITLQQHEQFAKYTTTTFLNALRTCTQLQASINDGLPQVLCERCAQFLESFTMFRALAMDNDSKLKKLKAVKDFLEQLAECANEEFHNIPVEYKRDEESDEVATNGATKDPLEFTESETEFEEEILPEFRIQYESEQELLSLQKDTTVTNTDEDADEEDDKPLKQIADKMRYELNDAAQQKPEAIKLEEVIKLEGEVKLETETKANEIHEQLAEGFIYPYTEVVSSSEDDQDYVANLEKKLFPQGRFKCLACERRYFTFEGIRAHQEYHKPKSAKAKQRRARGPNKNKRTKEENQLPKTEILTEEIIISENVENQPNAGDSRGIAQKTNTKKAKAPKPKKVYPCEYCGKEMISCSKLRYHMVMHTGEKDYLCTMCPKAYSTIYALKHHMRIHTGERPYECQFCGDRFLRPTTLKSHLRRHTGERPYGCQICGKRFIQHSSMATHMKLNHMDKTIPCPHCEKKYARQTDLNTHLLSHTGSKPFACQLCPSRFVRQANLNKHVNQHHFAKPENVKDKKLKRTTATATVTSIGPTPIIPTPAKVSEVEAPAICLPLNLPGDNFGQQQNHVFDTNTLSLEHAVQQGDDDWNWP